MVDHKLSVSKEFVRNALRTMDPEGVQRRSRHRLQMQQYHTKGPNFIWKLDGYDKLKPYGFCIHGCIDGYSIWMIGMKRNVKSSWDSTNLTLLSCSMHWDFPIDLFVLRGLSVLEWKAFASCWNDLLFLVDLLIWWCVLAGIQLNFVWSSITF